MEEDKYLYNNFLKGDMDSFKCLILKYKNNLIYFLLKYVKDMQIAEDISQDVFVYILVNKKKYNFKYSFKTYLFLIGKSRALNYLKREKKKLEIIENMKIDVEPSLENYIFKNEASEGKILRWDKLSSYEMNLIPYANVFRDRLREWFAARGKDINADSVKEVFLTETAIFRLGSNLAERVTSVVSYLDGESEDLHECLYCVARLRSNMIHGIKGVGDLDDQRELIKAAADVLSVF